MLWVLASNDYLQHMFYGEIRKNISAFWLKRCLIWSYALLKKYKLPFVSVKGVVTLQMGISQDLQMLIMPMFALTQTECQDFPLLSLLDVTVHSLMLLLYFSVVLIL